MEQKRNRKGLEPVDNMKLVHLPLTDEPFGIMRRLGGVPIDSPGPSAVPNLIVHRSTVLGLSSIAV